MAQAQHQLLVLPLRGQSAPIKHRQYGVPILPPRPAFQPAGFPVILQVLTWPRRAQWWSLEGRSG